MYFIIPFLENILHIDLSEAKSERTHIKLLTALTS